LARQEIPCILWNPKVHYCIRPPSVHILTQITAVHAPPNPTSWRSILILSSYLCLDLPSVLVPSGLPTKLLYAALPSPIQNSLQDSLTLNLTYQLTLTFGTPNPSSSSATTAAPETLRLLWVCSYGPITCVVLGRWMSWAHVQHSGHSTMWKWWWLQMCHLQCTDDTASNPTRSTMWDKISAPGKTRGAAASVWRVLTPMNSQACEQRGSSNDHSHNCPL
jgi:hypothetical protein